MLEGDGSGSPDNLMHGSDKGKLWQSRSCKLYAVQQLARFRLPTASLGNFRKNSRFVDLYMFVPLAE